MRFPLIALLVLAVSPALAQTVELQPSKLSGDDVAIRVVSVGPDVGGSRIAVEVANRTEDAKTAQVECSAFGAGDAPVGTETSYAERVPSKGSVVHDIASKHSGITRVLCRVVDVQNAR